jgi:hypothetical protein
MEASRRRRFRVADFMEASRRRRFRVADFMEVNNTSMNRIMSTRNTQRLMNAIEERANSPPHTANNPMLTMII